MEIQRQELPNSTLILIFGILSIIGCCCYGIVGLVFLLFISGLTIVIARFDKAFSIIKELGFLQIQFSRLI